MGRIITGRRRSGGGSNPYYADTVLQLHFDGDFADSSSYGHTATANGNAQIDASGLYYQCGLFDGTGDYLSIPDAASLRFGTGDFTIEAWVKNDATAANNDTLIAKGSGAFANGEWNLYIDNTNGDFVFRYSTTSYLTSSGSVVADGTWQHIAVCRIGTAMKMYVDGSEVASATHSGDFNTTAQLVIGGLGPGAGDFKGRIDELRLLDVGVYSGAFTPLGPFGDS
jgi:hypothetical protein